MTESSIIEEMPQDSPGRGTFAPERIPALKAALEAEQLEIETARQVLRLKTAEVERELAELTGQQANFQKVQVAINQLLCHLTRAEFPRS